MNKPLPNSPRARLHQLQAIPERQRTDAEWDELNELEIMLASGNREIPPGQQQHGMRGSGNQPNQGQGQGQRRDAGAPDGRNPSRKFHKRSAKRRGPGPTG